jgi:hypothetical protein
VASRNCLHHFAAGSNRQLRDISHTRILFLLVSLCLRIAVRGCLQVRRQFGDGTLIRLIRGKSCQRPLHVGRTSREPPGSIRPWNAFFRTRRTGVSEGSPAITGGRTAIADPRRGATARKERSFPTRVHGRSKAERGMHPTVERQAIRLQNARRSM